MNDNIEKYNKVQTWTFDPKNSKSLIILFNKIFNLKKNSLSSL